MASTPEESAEFQRHLDAMAIVLGWGEEGKAGFRLAYQMFEVALSQLQLVQAVISQMEVKHNG